MKKAKFLAAALAATFAFTVAPILDSGSTDVLDFSCSRSAFAQGNGVAYQVGLHHIPLVGDPDGTFCGKRR